MFKCADYPLKLWLTPFSAALISDARSSNQDSWSAHAVSETYAAESQLIRGRPSTYPVWRSKKGTGRGRPSTGGARRDHQGGSSTAAGSWTRSSPRDPGLSGGTKVGSQIKNRNNREARERERRCECTVGMKVWQGEHQDKGVINNFSFFQLVTTSASHMTDKHTYTQTQILTFKSYIFFTSILSVGAKIDNTCSCYSLYN